MPCYYCVEEKQKETSEVGVCKHCYVHSCSTETNSHGAKCMECNVFFCLRCTAIHAGEHGKDAQQLFPGLITSALGSSLELIDSKDPLKIQIGMKNGMIIADIIHNDALKSELSKIITVSPVASSILGLSLDSMHVKKTIKHQNFPIDAVKKLIRDAKLDVSKYVQSSE